MQNVISKDGTEIAFEKSGKGPALVIVGGSLADRHFYVPLAEQLAHHFTVYNFDRRGRGESGNTKPYAVEREVEDVEALIASIKEPVFMYGHSAGSALALQAAVAGLDIVKLALADPPYTPHSKDDAAAKAEHGEQAVRIQELTDKGDLKGSAKFFLSGYGLPDEELEALFRSPAGEGMINNARTLPYDYAMLGDGLVPTDLARKVKVPTLVLASKDMPETAQALVEAMLDAHLKAMEGPTHELSPKVLAAVLTNFFN